MALPNDILNKARGKTFLVIGGTGCIGAHIVAQIGKAQGVCGKIMVVGRKPVGQLLHTTQCLFHAYHATYKSVDVYADSPSQSQFFSQFDIVINAAEPYTDFFASRDGTAAAIRRDIDQTAALMQTLLAAGFSVTSDKVFVRVASPLEFRNFAEPWEGSVLRTKAVYEELLPLRRHDMHGRYAGKHPAWSLPYVQTKIGIRDAAQKLYDEAGLAVISAAPTYVLSWLNAHPLEYVEAFWRLPGWQRAWVAVPDFHTDMIAGDDMGDGVLRAALLGQAGQTYCIGGGQYSIGRMAREQLHYGNKTALPWLQPYPRGPLALEFALAQLPVLYATLLLWQGYQPAQLVYNAFALAIEISERESRRAQDELGHLQGVSPRQRRQRLQVAARNQMEFLKRVGRLG